MACKPKYQEEMKNSGYTTNAEPRVTPTVPRATKKTKQNIKKLQTYFSKDNNSKTNYI